jgi:hypothetical protein
MFQKKNKIRDSYINQSRIYNQLLDEYRESEDPGYFIFQLEWIVDSRSRQENILNYFDNSFNLLLGITNLLFAGIVFTVSTTISLFKINSLIDIKFLILGMIFVSLTMNCVFVMIALYRLHSALQSNDNIKAVKKFLEDYYQGRIKNIDKHKGNLEVIVYTDMRRIIKRK